MANIKIDGTLIEVPDHFTLLQAAEAAGAEIPRFCFHERLSAWPAIAACAWWR